MRLVDAVGGRMSGLRAMPAEAEDRADWDVFVAARPEADVLQAWAWGDVVTAAGGKGVAERAIRMLVRAEDGSVRGVAQALTRPTILGKVLLYVPHGPVWAHDDPSGEAVLRVLVDGLRDLARASNAIGVKVDPRQVLDGRTSADDLGAALEAQGFERSRYDLQARTTRVIDIGAPEADRIASWSGDARNRWRRALREGSTTEVLRTPDPEALAAFVGLLEGTAAHGRFRTRDAAFYSGLADAFAGTDRLHLALTTWSGRPIAAMYVVGVGDRAYYLYGASDRDVPRHTYGPYAAMAAMQAALAEDGVRSLDVWGVAEPGDPEADASWAGFSEYKIRFDGSPLRHPGMFDLPTQPVWWALRRVRERLGVAG